MANVGTAVVTVVPSMAGFSKAVSEEVAGAFDKASKKSKDSGSESGKGFGEGLGEGSKSGFTKLQESLANLKSVASAEAKNMASALSTAFSSIKSSGTFTQLSAKFSELRSKAADAFDGIQLEAGARLSILGTTVSRALSPVTSAISSAFTGATSAVKSALSPVASAVSSAFGKASNAVKSALSPVAEHTRSAFSKVSSFAKTALAPVASVAKGALGNLGSALSTVGSDAADMFKEGLATVKAKVSPVLSSLASTLSTGFKAAAIAGAAAVGATFAQALSGYADYEQMVGGVDKIFQGSSSKVQAYAAQAYQTAGVSANQYMEQVTSFSASLISSLGGDTSKAADLANVAMVSMSDNVNTYGTAMEDVQNAYQGFAKQNYTMLDNLKLGYGGTKSEMERLIADANEYGKSIGEAGDLSIDSFADIVQAIDLVQQKQNIAGTTAKEAATTISGSIGMAKAAWQNFMVGLADEDADFGKLTENLLNSIGSVAKNVAPRVAQIGAGIIAAFPKALAGLADILAPIFADAVASAWNIASSALNGLGISIPGLNAEEVMTAMTEIGTAIQTGMAQITAAVQPALQPIATAVQAIFTAIQTVLPALQNLATAVLPLIAPVLTIIATALTNLYTFLAPVVADVINFAAQLVALATPAIQAFANMLQVVLPAAISVLSAIWNAVFPTLSAVVTTVFGVVSSVVTTVMNTISSIISTVLAAINGDWDGVWSGIQSTFGSVWDGLKSAAQTGVDGLGQVVSTVKSTITGFFSGAGTWLTSAGSDLINGLTNGITSAVSGVTSALSGLANDAIATAKSILGIASPSKVFKQLGVYVDEGFAIGIEKAAASPAKAMRSVAEGVFATGSTSVRADIAGGTYRKASAASSGGGIVQNFNTKVVRSDADLYSAATIINRNALRLAGAC